MIVRNVTRSQLDTTLAEVSPLYDDNIVYINTPSATRKDNTAFNVRLTVKDSHAAGARINTTFTRHLHAACWHVYQSFLTHLPENAIVTSALGTWKHGDPFLDRNIGSQAYPCQASEACNC